MGTALRACSTGSPSPSEASGYLIGMLTVTADRSAANARALVSGLAGGVAAAAIWTVTALASRPSPPIPRRPS
jgi:hypothetical protein